MYMCGLFFMCVCGGGGLVMVVGTWIKSKHPSL